MGLSFAADAPAKETKADMALRVFCEDSTAHGLKRIVSAQTRPAQVFWAIIFLSAMGALVAHLYLRVDSYMQFRHQEITYTLYEPSKLDYPDVTVCNINPFANSQKNLEVQLREELLERPFQKGGQCDEAKYSRVKSEQNISRQYTEALATLAGFDAVANISHQKSDFIMYCKFASVLCSQEDFTSFIDTQYYQCHTISLNKMVQRLEETNRMPEPGAESGLSLILFLGAAAVNSSGSEDLYRLESSTMNTAGARVNIHRAGTRPKLRDYGMDVSAGFSTAIAIEPQVHKRLTKPYISNCTNDDSLPNGAVYTQNDCIDYCINKRIEEVCGCIHISSFYATSNTVKTSSMPICGSNVCNMTDWECANNLKYGESNEICLRSCPRKCEENSFNEKVSSSYWPGDDYQGSFYVNLPFDLSDWHPLLSRMIGEPTNDTVDIILEKNLIRKNFLRLNVFLETFYVRHSDEETLYELVVLLADFGGTLGLWAGISIISVIEFFEFAFTSTGNRIRRYFSKTQVSALPSSHPSTLT